MSGQTRGGFTLIEVLVAMVLLGFSVLGAQAIITDRLVQNVGRVDARSSARQLVEDRLQLVQTEPRYAELGARFGGAEGEVEGFPGYARTTVVDQRADHTVVTVTVITPIWSDTVAGTTVIGLP